MIESIKIWLFIIMAMPLSLCGIELFTVDTYPEEYVYDYYSYELIRELERAESRGLVTNLSRLEIYKNVQNDYYYYPKPEEFKSMHLMHATENKHEILHLAHAICTEQDIYTDEGAWLNEYYGLRFIADDGRQAYFPIFLSEKSATAITLGDKGWPLSICSSKPIWVYLIRKGITNATRP